MLAVSTVSGLRAADAFPKLSGQSDYQPARLDPKEPELEIVFPGAAQTKSIPEGTAVVSVAVNAQGQATDFLITSYTDKSFGLALLDHAKTVKYQAGTFRGVSVAGRYDLGYRFLNRSSMGLNAVDAGRRKAEGSGAAKVQYDAVEEKNLDAPLEIVEVALPKLPPGYAAPTDHPVKVFVSFYIDEEGKVRLPQVDSAAAPELIPGALKAVSLWAFKPATVKGSPVLVYTGRPVGFLPRNPPASPAAGQ